MKHYHKYFGSTLVFPQSYNVDSPLSDAVQPPGNEQCVVYSIDDICQDKFGFDIDIDELYSRIPHGGNGGTDPHTVIQEVLDHGVKWKQSGLTSKPFLSSFIAETGEFDKFDNVRSAIIQEKCSILTWGEWQSDWGVGSVMTPPTRNADNYHCVSIKGWDIINGETQLIIEAHTGRFLYASRAVFNAWAKTPYFGTAILSEKPVASLMEKLINALTSLIGLYKKKDNTMNNFDTPQKAFHSVRVMCDAAGLSYPMKNDLCATIMQESGFIYTAVGKKNTDGSQDFGLCQYNFPRWIGTNKLFSTPQDCINNPERAVKNMIQCFKDGHANWWMGYTVRQKWLAPDSPMWKLKVN